MRYLLCQIEPHNGFRHPVKERELRAALDGAGVDCVRAVFFTKRSDGVVLSAGYRSDPHADEPGRVTLVVQPVRGHDCKRVRRLLRDQGFERFLAWLDAARRDTIAVRRLDIHYRAGELTIVETVDGESTRVAKRPGDRLRRPA